MTLTPDEVAMFYAIFSCAERVDWACYEAFRLAILTEGAKQTTAAPLAADPQRFRFLLMESSTVPRVMAVNCFTQPSIRVFGISASWLSNPDVGPGTNEIPRFSGRS